MDCNRVRLLMHGYLDGELDLALALEVEEHLKTCSACAQEYAGQLKMLSAIAEYQADLVYPVPSGLGQRVRSAVRKANGKRPVWSQFSWWQAAAAALVVMVLVLAAGIAGGRFIPRPENQLTAEVQSAHVRSLMAGHLTDVASTDQHTVKPWFNGKLDFSPPVEDLAAEGFPLVGGRLDYIDDHPVAALVYRRNKHDINLFIWPSTDPVAGLQASTYHGYNVYHWSQSGMDYWAVSDREYRRSAQFFRSGTAEIPITPGGRQPLTAPSSLRRPGGWRR